MTRPLNRAFRIKSGDLDISAAGSAFITRDWLKVPKGMMWRLYHIEKEGTTGSTIVLMHSEVDGGSSRIGGPSAGNTEQRLEFSGMPMYEDDSIGLLSTGNGADTGITLIIAIEEIYIG